MKIISNNMIPRMWSNQYPKGIASASENSPIYPTWFAFTYTEAAAQAIAISWLTSSAPTATAKHFLAYQFENPTNITLYQIYPYSIGSPKSWTFEASNNGTDWVVLDTRSNVTGWVAYVPLSFSFTNNQKYLMYRINISDRDGTTAYVGINQLTMHTEYEVKFLIKKQDKYLSFNSEQNSFVENNVLSDYPSVQDFYNYGIDYIENIPRETWFTLDGEISLYYYTTDKSKNTVELNIESEGFSLYDILGDTVNIIAFSDLPQKNSVNLSVQANYNPLDELNEPVLLAWSSDEAELSNKYVQSTNIPKPVLVKQNVDFKMSEIQSIVLNAAMTKFGKIKVIFSTDKGITWYSVKTNINGTSFKKRIIDTEDLKEISAYGISIDDLNSLNASQWKSIMGTSDAIRFAYYLEKFRTEDVAEIDQLITRENLVSQTPTLSNLNIIYNRLNKEYSGLMFMDTKQQYFSTSFGDILKYLDFGTLVVGQTSLVVEVVLNNTYIFDVKNIRINSQHNIRGLNVELSWATNPFLSQAELFRPETLKINEKVSFFVRLTVDSDAQSGGNFTINVKSDFA